MNEDARLEPSVPECVERWQRWSVRADGPTLARLIEALDAARPSGWSRIPDDVLDRIRATPSPGSYWYAFPTTPTALGSVVNIRTVRGSELWGGRISHEWPQHGVPDLFMGPAYEEIMRFLDNGIVPAAKSVGAHVTVPTFAELFLSGLVGDMPGLLRRFSESSRKSLPLTSAESDCWRAFVVEAFRTKTAIDPERFARWLRRAGWSREDAETLNDRFLEESLLLMRFVDEVSLV